MTHITLRPTRNTNTGHGSVTLSAHADVAVDNHDKSTPNAKSDEAIRVYGRFMRPNQMEYPCRAEFVDEMNLVIASPIELAFGEYVVTYLDGFGRIAGKVVHQESLTFTIDIDATLHKRNKIVEAALSLRLGKNVNDSPRFSRMPAVVDETDLRIENGSTVSCQIQDMSLGGALLKTFAAPPIGTRIRVGQLDGTVIRHHPDGIAIQFAAETPLDSFQEFFSK